MNPLHPELVLTTPQYATSDHVVSYRPEDLRTIFGNDGQVIAPRELYLPRVQSTHDIFDEDVYVLEPNPLGWGYRIWFSRQCGIITGIDIQMPNSTVWVQCLSRVDTGQALGCAALYRFQTNTPVETRYNPTMGGAIDPEFGRWGGAVVANWLHGSPCTYYWPQHHSASQMYINSSTIPLHFGGEYGDSEPGARTHHDGDEWHPLIMPRFEHRHRVGINKLAPNIITSDFTEICPVEVPSAPGQGFSINTSWWMPGPGDAPTFLVPGKPEMTWTADQEWEDQNRAPFALDVPRGITINNVRVNTPVRPNSGDPVAVIMPTPRHGWPVIGLAGRIHTDGEGLTQATEISALIRRNNQWDRTQLQERDRNMGRTISIRSRDTQRAMGPANVFATYVLGETVEQVAALLHAEATRIV